MDLITLFSKLGTMGITVQIYTSQVSKSFGKSSGQSSVIYKGDKQTLILIKQEAGPP